MANHLYNNVTEFKHIPIDEALLYYDAEWHSFQYLEDNSVLVIKPILRDNDEGGKTPVAYKIEVQARIIQSNYGDMRETFERIINKNINGCSFSLRSPLKSTDVIFIDTSNPATALAIDLTDVNLEITYDETQPALVISIQRTVSIDFVESAKWQ